MTNVNNTTLVEYNQEIQPKLRKLFELKDALKEWIDSDAELNELYDALAQDKENIKKLIEEKNPDLLREIKDIELDVKLACKSAAKNTEYTPAEIKSYLIARAKQSVEKTLEKAATFSDLELEFV